MNSQELLRFELRDYFTSFLVQGREGCVTRRILVPGPGIRPVPPAMEVWHPNHWATREFLHHYLNTYLIFYLYGCTGP